jgi:hypothetical protein
MKTSSEKDRIEPLLMQDEERSWLVIKTVLQRAPGALKWIFGVHVSG